MNTRLVVAVLFLGVAWPIARAEADDPLPTVRERLFDFFLFNGDCTQVDPKFCATGGCVTTCGDSLSFSETLLPDFTWPDVNYTDRTSSFWNTSTHLSRVVYMARSYRCSSCPILYQNASFLTQIQGAVALWLQHDFTNPNWWWNCFGVPQLLEVTTILLGNDLLTPSEITKVLAILARANGSYTGENFVWSQGVTIGRAVIAGDEAMLAKTFATLWKALFYSPREADGVQVDGSFFQHGPLLQSGAYGADFSMDLMVYANIAVNTSLAVGPAAMDVLASLVLDGQQFMIRWNGNKAAPVTYWDVSVKGREISRPPTGQVVMNTGPIITAMRGLGGPRAGEFAAMADRLSGRGAALVGSRHYFCADYTSHHKQDFFISLHLHSVRSLPAECVNRENLKGWHMADGAAFVYQDGAEYEGIFPVWSWTRIPGITARQDVNELICTTVGQRGTTAFVGGLCHEDRCVSGMDFLASNWGGAGELLTHLSAHKAWFLLDEGMVALGANVSLGLDAPVTTTIDQCLLRAPVYTGSLGADPQLLPDGSHQLTGLDYISHHNITYLLRLQGASSPAPLLVQNTVVNGSWSELSDACSAAVVHERTLTVEIDHGSRPQGGSYAYAVLPATPVAAAGSSAQQFNKHTSVLANSPAVQSVLYSTANETVILVAAFNASTVVGPQALQLQIAQQSFWIVTLSGGRVTFAASTPLAQASVQLRINEALSGGSGGITCISEGGWTTVTAKLPTAPTLVGSAAVGVCA